MSWPGRDGGVATKRSAGILLYRDDGDGDIEFLLVHPGGPYWARRDDGAWSIPKGGIEEDEDSRAAALRELDEELGSAAPELKVEALIDLGQVRQRAGKVVDAWGAEGDFDPAALDSNTFAMEWPPRSGREVEFPEVDRADWFDLEAARRKLLPAQREFLDRLLGHLGRG
jgi:predicted NUDIX family NTP pyrophosphohydrolase